VIAARLPRHSWPEADVRLVAVETGSGMRRVFTRRDGLPLVDVVAASCAIPLVWPPVPLDGGLWMDGGTYSAVNADLAAGQDLVLVLAPMVDEALADQVRGLEGHGSVLVLSPDAAATAAMGPDPMDLAALPRTARAGREQGRSDAGRVAREWPSARSSSQVHEV
jgi:NTE family protein